MSGMNIPDGVQKFKPVQAGLRYDLVVVVIFVLMATASFGLGYLAGKDTSATPVRIEYPQEAAVLSGGVEGKYVASISGTKYYLKFCSGASRIKEENKIYFDTKVEAENAGYEPARNCPGI